LTKTLLMLSAAEVAEDIQNQFGAIYPAMIPVTDGERLIDRTVAQYQDQVDHLYIAVSAEDTTIANYIQQKELAIEPVVVAANLSLSESTSQALSQIQAKVPLQTLTLIFGDTLVTTDDVTRPDSVFTHAVGDAGRWTTVAHQQGRIVFNDRLFRQATKKTCKPLWGPLPSVTGKRWFRTGRLVRDSIRI